MSKVAVFASLVSLVSACGGATCPPSSEQRIEEVEVDKTESVVAKTGPFGTDCHMHVDPDGIFDGNIPNDAARALVALDGAGLEKGCLLSPARRLPKKDASGKKPTQEATTKKLNDWTLAEAAKSDRLIPFCSVRIGSKSAPAEVTRCANAGGRGLKLHPVSQQVSIQDKKVRASLDAIAEAASAAQIPILIHIDDGDAGEVDALFDLAKSHPELTIIGAHMLARSIAKMMTAPKNIVIEVSGLVLAPKPAWQGFAGLFRQIGMERILLGSDWPLIHPSEHVAAINSMPLTDEEKAMILGGNANRLFSASKVQPTK